MANDEKKKKGFFGIFKRNKVVEDKHPQLAPEPKVEEYKGIPAEFLVSRGLENTTGLPKIDALGSYDDQFDLTTDNSQSISSENINAPESNVNNNVEANNFSSVVVASQEEKAEPEIVKPDEPIYVENSTQTVNYQQNIPNNEQQVAPNLEEFTEPQIKQENVAPFVDELYNMNQVQGSNIPQGHSR